MTVRRSALLSTLLLLGGTACPALADLVPVEPELPPALMYGVPSPEPVAPPPAASAAPGKAQGANAAPAKDGPAKDGPAELEDGWEGGAAREKDGKFAYCVVEGRFNSGHVLLIARSPKGETNIGIGIPGAELPKGEQWPVKVAVDNKLTRERVAVASGTDMLVVPNGKDEELVTALMNGKQLVVSSASDRIAFTLKGTKKVLTDLKTCVDKAGDVPPINTSTGVKTSRLPPGLVDLLAAAGLRGPELVPMDNIPKDQRPADVAWRVGPLVGGIRERVVEEGAKLDDLSGAFADAMKSRCEGTGTIALNNTEAAGAVSVRTGAVRCELKDGTLHVALTFMLAQGRLFTVLFHEATENDVVLADKARDNLAQVLLRAAGANAAAQGQGVQSQGQGQGQAPAAPGPAAPAAGGASSQAAPPAKK
ncbi:hypothetical protein [Azospirillum thermophilum]|uniref:Uncharacterized protein n=1 Tax=Azospirillum thermophilum TaxID=2202148 RepID=A0A2S2CZQ2_9PROT|nr:hypothetical protein [Azospirillum thermophilum]AWK89982.1 hypothetical protein DEW08_28685 [Azospirillum thermophilum]